MRNLEELLAKYVDRFDEGFPMRLSPADTDEVMDIIEECLEKGEPYDPYDEDFDPEADY